MKLKIILHWESPSTMFIFEKEDFIYDFLKLSTKFPIYRRNIKFIYENEQFINDSGKFDKFRPTPGQCHANTEPTPSQPRANIERGEWAQHATSSTCPIPWPTKKARQSLKRIVMLLFFSQYTLPNLYPAIFDGDNDCLRPVVDVHFLQNVADVVFNGFFTDV